MYLDNCQSNIEVTKVVQGRAVKVDMCKQHLCNFSCYTYFSWLICGLVMLISVIMVIIMNSTSIQYLYN